MAFSTNKRFALLAFIQTRMSGKYTDHLNNDNIKEGYVLKDEKANSVMNDKIVSIAKELRDIGYSVDRMNNMPPCLTRDMIFDYYIKMMNIYEKHTGINEATVDPNDDRNLVIESVLGLSLLSALHDEVGMKLEINYDYLSLLEEYEEKNNNRSDLVFRMHKIASDIFTTIRNYEYKINKRPKPNRKKKKKR